MKTLILTLVSLCFSVTSLTATAADGKAVNEKSTDSTIEVDTTRIKANKEQPNILYVVPWKEMENSKTDEQKLVLHDFFGNLYDPVLPAYSETSIVEPSEKTK